MNVEKRIESLEKQVRLYKRVGFLACCVVAVLVVWAVWPGPKVLKVSTIVAETIIAKKFGLKPDRSEKFLSVWGMGDDGPMFFMSDNKDGNVRQIFMTMDESGPAMGLTDANGMPRLSIRTVKRKSNGEEYPAIHLLDKNGKNHVLLMARDREASGLSFFDSSGELRLAMGLLAKQRPRIFLLDAVGHSRADLSLSESGEPTIELLNAKDKVIWSAPPVSK